MLHEGVIDAKAEIIFRKNDADALEPFVVQVLGELFGFGFGG